MATNINTILGWFTTRKKPTQAQFWASWQSFWHKDEQIPQSSITNLTSTLNAKTEKSQFEAHKTDPIAHTELFVTKENKSSKGVAGGYAPLDSFTKLAAQYLNIVNDLTAGGATELLSAEQGKNLKGQIDAINTLLTSDNVNLDTVQEIVDAIETMQTSLGSILVNDLTTGGTTKALTAEMGKLLQTNKVDKVTGKGLSTEDYSTQEKIQLAGIPASLDLKENKSNKGIADGYAPLDAFTKLASQYLNIVNDLTTGGATELLSAEQGKNLKGQIDAINIVLASDNFNLDTVQEIVDAIETIQTSLGSILVNDLTTGGTTKALTAEMGKLLQTNKVDKVTGKGLSTEDYSTQEKIQLAGIPASLDLKENKSNKGVVDGYAPLDEFAKIASQYLNIVNDLTTGGVTELLSAEQGKNLKGQIDAINILLASNNVNLDTVQEIAEAIETMQTSLGSILVNDLVTGGTTKALTAEMGKLLQTNKVDKITGKSLLLDSEITRLGVLSNYTHPANHAPSIITQDASNRFVTDAEKAVWNGKQSSLGFTAENAANKNVASGYAGLGADGKLISSQLPSITISDTFVTASQAAMLAVTAETGDVVVRTDLNKSYILKGTNPTVLADWQELLTPTDSIATVFGRNGTVTAQTGDYTADQITETGTRKFQSANQQAFNDATSSIQTQLNAKVTNATHTGDATGSTALTVKGINGTLLSGLATGILKNTTATGVPVIATVRTDYAEPTTTLATGILKNTTSTGAHTIAVASDFPTLNQNTTGSAGTITGSIAESQVTNLVTDLGLKVDKVTGKSLLSDTEITRLGALSNYTHPANHAPSIITQDTNNRFVTDAEKAAWNGKQSSLGFTAENAANKNVASGYAGLGADGKLISSQLPSITISDTFVTASQAAMLAVTAETGDVVVRTDLNKSYILKGTNPTVLADWQELLTPTDSIATVFGRNGTVTAQTGDYTTDQINETGTRVFQTPTQKANNNATSPIQGQLDTKQTTLVSGTSVKTVNSSSLLGSGNIAVEPVIASGTTSQYYRGDKSWQTLDKAVVGLSNVDNTTDLNKPISTATQMALNGKQALGNYEPVFTKNTAFNKNFGTVAGTVAQGNDSRIINGQTAFGWGNHAGLYKSIYTSDVPYKSITNLNTLFTGYNRSSVNTSQVNNQSTFSPDITGTWGLLTSCKTDDATDYGIQTYVSMGEIPNSYVRNCNNGTWGAWRNFLTDSNYNNYSPTLTGGGASGTWGINITGNCNNSATSMILKVWDNRSADRQPTYYSGHTIQPFFNEQLPNMGTWGSGINVAGWDVGTYESWQLYGGSSTSDTSSWYLRSGKSTWGAAYKIIHSGNIASQSVNYSNSAGSAPNANNANSFYNVNSGDGYGIQFWSSSAYKISMGVSSLYQYGPVTDYSIKTQMDNGSPGRGFTWGRESYAPIASLNSTSGNMQISGNFLAVGDVTAYYSDERLKRKTGKIESPIDKVKSLDGFYYVNNELANEKGYTDTKQQLGLSAQQVKSVLPEIVTLAAFDTKTNADGSIESISGEDYLTVNYAKIVPLLVEAIKEQQTQIEELKDLVTKLMKTWQ